jgi:p-hydroxybenzoate 3-monooxygenase
VAIIGGGPAGLLLSHILHRNGIDSIVLERQSRTHVLARIRAGVLEAGTVTLLREVGLGARMEREGHPHDGSAIAWEGRPRFFIEAKKFTGKAMMAYGQTAITEDLYSALDAVGGQVIDEADNVRLHQLTSGRPYVTFEKEGSRLRIDCDYVAGCDGYHGVSRPSIPSSMLRTYEKSYPFGWLGIMSETPPYPDLCYCYHSRGFALASMRNPMLSRYYIQCDLDAQLGLARRPLLAGVQGAMSAGHGRQYCDRPVNRKIHCAVTKFRYRADAVRRVVPGRRRRPHRPSDRGEGA